MTGITFKLEGRLVYEPSVGSVPRESLRRAALGKLDSRSEFERRGAQATIERLADPASRLGRYSNGVPFTVLRVEADTQQVHVIVRGKLAQRVSGLEPGTRLRITGKIAGDHPHHRLHASRVTELEPGTSGAIR